MTNKKYIGIDFGTTNCCVAFTQLHPKRGSLADPQVIEFNGQPTVQNVLVFSPDGQKLLSFGDDIYDSHLYLEHPEAVQREFKLRLHQDAQAQRAAVAMFSQIAGAIRHSLNVERLDAERHQVILGAPAQWGDVEIKSLLQAAVQGGIPEPGYAPEPVGAMLYHAFVGDISFSPDPEYNLIIDFGGGTTDIVTLSMALDWPQPKVVHVFGEAYGGRDFDQLLAEYLKQRYWRGQNWNPRLEVQMEQFARRFKERFNSAVTRGQNEYEQICGLPRFDQNIGLSVMEFQSPKLAGPLIERFHAILKRGLEGSNLPASQYARVILTGGSSRWYFVEDAIREVLGNITIIRSSLPEQTIAKGLALCSVDPTAILIGRQGAREIQAQEVQVIPAPVTPYQPTRTFSPFGSEPGEAAAGASLPSPWPSEISDGSWVKPANLVRQTALVGGILLGIFLLLDLFIPVLGIVPVLPETTLCCALPAYLTAILIAYAIDSRRRGT